MSPNNSDHGTHRYKEEFKQCIEIARKNGFRKTILWLKSRTRVTLEIYRDATGKVPGSSRGSQDRWTDILTKEAIRILIPHLGVNTSGTDRLLRDTAADFSLVILGRDGISAQLCMLGTPFLIARFPYNSPNPTSVRGRLINRFTGRGMLIALTEDGHRIPLCGPSPYDALSAASVFAIALNPDLRMFGRSRPDGLEVVEEFLVRYMQPFADAPAVVAEAIRALRKLADERSSWLDRVLFGRPEFKDLADQVRREL